MGRVPLVLTVLAALCVTTSASAQTARARGTVRDMDGKGIKGATIRAVNQELSPRAIVSTSDDKGRWAMLGLHIGTYDFVVEAPGFLPLQAAAGVRTAASAELVFTLARDPGPVPGALQSNIQAQVAAANMLRDQGRLDQAISAYQDIRARNPKLTTINLVIGHAYRQKAAQESDVEARVALLERAIDAYTALLALEPENDRVARDLETVRAEATRLRP